MSRVSSWVRADYVFASFRARRAVVRVAAPVLLLHPGWSQLLQTEDPEAIGAALTRLLALAHDGQYAGGEVVAMSFNAFTACWELLIVHPSLDALPDSLRAPEVTLTITNAIMQQALETT